MIHSHRTIRLLFALGALVSGCASAPMAPPAQIAEPYDVVMRNARIVDGSGNPWFMGDVAVRGDRIAAVGRIAPSASTRRTIDATGLVVAPGFIDMLGHSERALLTRPTAVSKVTQGITSEITGEVDSAWPSGTPSTPSTDSWHSLGEYFQELLRHGTGINLGTYVAAGSVRRAVLGDASRHPSAGELSRMEALVDSAMRDGAMGFSTGLIYAPSTFFSTEEIAALATRAGRYGGGYASHIRSEGDSLLPAIREAIAVGRTAGTWVEIRHLKASGEKNWGSMRSAVALIDSARHAGIDVSADVYPYTASGTGLAAILPTWVLAGGTDSMLARLRDPAVRDRLRATRGDATRKPQDVMVNTVRVDSLRRYEGKRLDAIARERGTADPYEAAYDILVADRGATSAIYFTMSEDDLRLALRQPWTSIGQDAGASTPDGSGRERGHPRAYGTFPRILARYVRDDSLLTLENAVRKMTSLAAQRVGLHDRGMIATGMFADVILFDAAEISDRATYEHPQLPSVGMRYVFVNGVPVIDDRKLTGALPGRALLGPGAKK